MLPSHILLNGLFVEQLIELLRPMIREEIRQALFEQLEKLLSTAKAYKLYKPAITKATTVWALPFMASKASKRT